MLFFRDLLDAPRKTLIGRLIFLLLCLMIVTHLVIFIILSDTDKRSELRVNRDLMVQQTLHLIQVVLTTPPDQREKVVDAIDVPNTTISMTDQPAYALQFSQASMWEILERISTEQVKISLSVHLQAHQWLNVGANITPRTWTLQLLLLALELILAMAVIFYLWSINRFIIPLRRFALAVNRLGRNLNAEPLDEAGPPVVMKAASAMNIMQGKLRDLIRDRTQMLAAISHDLRTPITRMKLRSQLIDDMELREKNVRDLDEMEAMISEILLFAKEDSMRGEGTRVEFTSLMDVMCEDLQETFQRVTYDCKVKKSMRVLGRSLALKRAISNVVQNAVKYGHKAHVILSYDKSDNVAVVTVDDNGPGISQEHLEKVFSPFYRAEKSRSRETGGTGLGLAVTRDIIRGHGGEVSLKNMHKGLRVTITLPLEGEGQSPL